MRYNHAAILGGTGRLLDVGKVLHRVPSEIVHARLREDLDTYCEGPWYAVILYDDGRGSMRGVERNTSAPEEEVIDRMVEFATRLNVELHNGGHWIVAWGASRLSAIWRDGDGDMHVDICFDDPWPRIKEMSVADMCQQAHRAGEQYLEAMRMLDLKNAQMVKRALGEQNIRTH